MTRWLGFLASVLLMVVAFLAGSYDHHDAAWVAGTVLWYPATALLVYAWWSSRRRPMRWLLVTGLLWAVPLLLGPALGSHDVYAYACQGQLVDAGLDVYRVGPSALPCSWLSSVPELWRGTPTPYGPLWLVLSGAAARVAGGSLPVAVTGLRVIGLLGTALCGWAAIRLSRALGVEPARVVWLVALSPLVLIHVVSGAHNDILLAGLILVALAAAGPRPSAAAAPSAPGAAVASAPTAAVASAPTAAVASAPTAAVASAPSAAVGAAGGGWAVARPVVIAGVALGLAAAVKVTALAAAPFVIPLLLVAERPRPTGRVVRLTALLGVVVGATYTVLALVTGYGIGFVHALASTSGLVQWLSLPTGVGMAVGYVLRVAGAPHLFGTAVAIARGAGYLALAATLGALWWWAVRRARDATGVVAAAGLALLAVAVLGPVFYAWYAISGLAVLAVATAGRSRAVAIAAAGLIFLTLPDSLGLATKTKLPGAFLDVALVVFLLVKVRSGALSRWWCRPAPRPAAAGTESAGHAPESMRP